jgi:outer membrane protein assembly factor BamB
MNVRNLSLTVAVILPHTLAPAHAADWYNYGGDPQRSGWQRREKSLNVTSVKGLKLLWKRQLDNRSNDLNSLTAPTMLGPIVTHRGIKELVFIAGSSDNLYAVDADLGKVFWKRRFDSPAPSDLHFKWSCGEGLTATPAIAPDPDLPIDATPDDPEDEDDFTPLLPIYVLSSDGNLHTVRPSDGEETAPAVKFIPANANSSSLNFAGNVVYAATSDRCGGSPNGVWAMDLNSPDPKAGFFPSTDTIAPGLFGVSIGFDGTIYSAAGRILSLTPGNLKLKDCFTLPEESAANATPVPFTWKGHGMLVVTSRDGRLFLLDHGEVLAFASTASGFTGSLATWADASGTRWIYTAGRRGVAAFRLSGEADQPKPALVWTSRDLGPLLPPVVANGVLFALSGGEKSTHAILYAFDAVTGKELYSSGGIVTSFAHSSGLAVANGHVCFGTWDNTLYCFGLPIEI